MGLVPSLFGNEYKLVVVDYVSKCSSKQWHHLERTSEQSKMTLCGHIGL